eukprot:SM000164S02246  [mRNA]  locus=s164:66662:72058:- [translate_table: standard]
MQDDKSLEPKPALEGVAFGAVYTDHMLSIAWSAAGGWAPPRISPLKPFELHPCAQVLHYAMECFEGMKAYQGPDGTVRLFRPAMNMARLARSAERLYLPRFDQAALLECIKELVRVEKDWIPTMEGFSVYIRPTIIATTPALGVAPPSQALFFCVLSPVGPYFPTGLTPIRLLVDLQHARACRGGVGDRKIGGNYAPTILPQVLYVLQDGSDVSNGLVGESGSMNVFFLMRQRNGSLELVTPPLDGLVLPGVTRDTVLALVRSWDVCEVAERPLRWRELEEAHDEGRLVETFGSGTACMIQPISSLVKHDDTELAVPYDQQAVAHWLAKVPGSPHDAAVDPFSLVGRLTRAISDIQYGHVPHKWSETVESVRSVAAAGGGGGGGGEAASFYPRIAQPVGTPTRTPPPVPLAASASGSGIRVAIKPEYRVAPAVQLSPHFGDVPRSTFQPDFTLERQILADVEQQERDGGIGAASGWHAADGGLAPGYSNGSVAGGFADDPVVNKYAAMGLRMEAVVLAVATYGDVQNKVVDFCSAYGQLTEMGFSSEAVAGALAMYDNDRERALAQLAP